MSIGQSASMNRKVCTLPGAQYNPLNISIWLKYSFASLCPILKAQKHISEPSMARNDRTTELNKLLALIT
jgi:hypothetical protein